MKFRKKPVVIEANQWFKDGDHPAVYFSGKDDGGRESWVIRTAQGWRSLTPGDWIITELNGDTHLCKPDIFDLTHEAVND